MKWIAFVLIISCLLLFPGCGSPDPGLEGEDTGPQASGESVEVDKGLFDVTITMPASMVDSENIEATVAEAKEQGIKEVVVNEDGSVTYRMSKSVHSQMMKDLKEGFHETVEDYKSGDEFASVKDIKYNKNLTSITLMVEKETFENSLDSFAVFGLGFVAMYYQLFDGIKADNIAVTIDIQDSATGEVFKIVTYPDDLETTD
ncbi:MAG: hypothetical protein GX883_05385 [Firmicutes bacterium]|nr:hypothetical protein [Bacillota bacterium]